MAARFKIGREQWLDMLERERGINVQHYRRDILWPTLALRKCAAEQLNVSEEDLTKAYEAQYGPAVKCRLIVVNDRQTAEEIRRQVTDRPDDFARLAMQHSQDVNSASIGVRLSIATSRSVSSGPRVTSTKRKSTSMHNAAGDRLPIQPSHPSWLPRPNSVRMMNGSPYQRRTASSAARIQPARR